MSDLTAKQARFVEEYMIDLNATQAAIRAGYSKKGASVRGAELLAIRKVADAVAEAKQARSERTEITADRVLQELAVLGFANMEDYVRIVDGEPWVDLSCMTREQAAAISETIVEDHVEGRGSDRRTIRKVRIKFHDKKGALAKMGEHFGMFTQNVEHSGPGGSDIPVRLDYGELSVEEVKESRAEKRALIREVIEELEGERPIQATK